MRVDCNSRNVPYFSQHDRGCLAPDPPELDELVDVSGNLAVVHLLEVLGELDDRLGLLPVEAGGVDDLLDLLGIGLGEIGGRWIALE